LNLRARKQRETGENHMIKTHDLYSSNTITVVNYRYRWSTHAPPMWEMRNTHKILVGNSEGKTAVGRSGYI